MVNLSPVHNQLFLVAISINTIHAQHPPVHLVLNIMAGHAKFQSSHHYSPARQQIISWSTYNIVCSLLNPFLDLANFKQQVQAQLQSRARIHSLLTGVKVRLKWR
jgi:hypothetical protein